MDVSQSLAELAELSSQVERAVVLDSAGSVLGSTLDDPGAAEAVAQAARDLLAGAAELRPTADEVTRVEIELAEGGVFVLREGGRTIAATTGPRPTSGLVAYDLRTCLQALDEPTESPRPTAGKPKEDTGK
jgi:predicted regulator of Ras-like GTPase activity (Roadblock/LC7/MglB family)